MIVGRDREIDAIGAAIERAQRGERAAVMLTGEPGIGKSTLLDELARRVTAAGGVAVWGRSAEVGVTPPFWPWTQVLAALEIHDEQPKRSDRTPRSRSGEPSGRDESGSGVRRVETLLADLADQPAAATRLARFEEVLQLVQRCGRDRLTALVFDDAHAADLGSLQLLEYALPRLAGNVVIAIAARDSDASPTTAAALGRIQRAARRMPLRRLDRGEIAGLVEDRGADARVASRVYELTEGNPLFAVELLESITDGVLQLPAVSSVRAIVRDRVDRMPDGTAELLAAAAIVGREFRAAVVADMLGISDAEATRRLDPVRKLGMVAAMTADRHKFSHALIAEALADELEPSERARLHLRAAQAIEKRDGGEPAAVAHHLLEAGHLAAEAAVAAAERAAAAAMARLGFEDAAALLERAVAALALAAPNDLARRAALECRWAEALQHAGDHARGAERCESAARLARELGDVELLARIAIVRGIEMRFGRTDPLLVAALREALERLGDGGERTVLRAKLLARLAAAEQPANDPAGPVALAWEAIELGRTLPDRDRLAVLYTATAALVDYVPPDRLEAIHRETLALATALDDRQVIVHQLVRLCFTAVERFDRGELSRLHGELRARATALGLPRWVRTVHLLDAMIALLDGRFADAERAADTAEAVVGNDADGRWLVDTHRLFATSVKTTLPGLELRELALDYEPARNTFACWLATLDGDHDRMRTTLALEDLRNDLELAMMLAPAVAAVGSPERRTELYQRGLARRGRAIVASMLGFTLLDLHDRLLMLLAASLGRWDDALAHGAEGLAIAERLASPVWIARMRADLADVLELRDRRDPRIAELRTLALVDAERIGMPGVVERCRGVRRPAPAVTANVAIERAGELWSVRGFGEHTHVKDSRGIQILAQLIANPGREIHVLELTGSGAVDGGDAGEVLDATARAQYRVRLGELVAERDEAEAWGDAGRAERASAEIEALTSELERAVGLGGRERRVGSASERARSNVQRRVNHALQQIRTACPRLGEHLAATVHTGTYCHYAP